jgi:hypothetical protein
MPQVPQVHQSCVRTDLTGKNIAENDLVYVLTAIDTVRRDPSTSTLEVHRLVQAVNVGLGSNWNLMPSSALCRAFLGQRRGARRLEDIRRVVAAAVG